MAKPNRKSARPDLAQRPGPKLVEEDRQSSVSPARQLQARLHAQFQPEIAPVWTRYVTLFLAFGLLGAWMFGLSEYTGSNLV